MVIAIKNREENKSFTVRRIATNLIGVERIFPLGAPTIEKIEVVKQGTSGSRHAKLYYTREKSRREVDQIYDRAARRVRVAEEQKNGKKSKTAAKPVAKAKSKAKKTVKKTSKK
jgi:large subunit ribosomal protein L19